MEYNILRPLEEPNSLSGINQPQPTLGELPRSIGISILALLTLPTVLAIIFVGFGVVYAGGLRPVIFELSWLTFAFVLIGTSIASKAPVIGEAKILPRAYLAVFTVFAIISVYTTVAVAPSVKMSSYAIGTSVTAILAGLAAAAQKRRFGDKIIVSISWALFVAMLLHAPFWIWLFVIEGNNPEFDWLNRTPGYPSIRTYGYSVEASIAAGLGLYYLSDRSNKVLLFSLALGTTFLWMLLFWSGGRGAFLALLASSTLVAFIAPKFISRIWKFFVATIAVGAGLSLLLPVPNSAYGLLRRADLDAIVNSGSMNELSSNRMSLWSDAYSIFLDKPLFGHGMLQYSHITTDSTLTEHIQVHNILLEALISFGLVGTAAVIFLLGKIWVLAAIRLRRPDTQSTLPVFLIATTLLVHGLVSGTYYHIHSALIIAISLGLLLHDHGEQAKSLD